MFLRNATTLYHSAGGRCYGGNGSFLLHGVVGEGDFDLSRLGFAGRGIWTYDVERYIFNDGGERAEVQSAHFHRRVLLFFARRQLEHVARIDAQPLAQKVLLKLKKKIRLIDKEIKRTRPIKPKYVLMLLERLID